MTHKIYGHHLKGSAEKQDWYIGRTGQEKLEDRWKNGNGYGKNQPKIYNTIKKYGWDNFEHILIAECETEEQAILAEAIFKKMYDSVNNGYNCKEGEESSPPSRTGVTPWNKGTKGVMKANSGTFQKGNVMTEEHKNNISKSKKGKRPKNLDALHDNLRGRKFPGRNTITEDSRKKISESLKEYWRKKKNGST